MRYFVIWCVVVLVMAGIASSGEPKQPPKELTVDLGGGVKMEMVLIPAGEFMMGSPDSNKAVKR
jgi:formylglycine-generating enzyme required for sulfatase activity